MNLHLDFETRSAADLKKVGLHAYAEHPTTEILCAAYAKDDGPVVLWWPGCRAEDHDCFFNAIVLADTVTAHNAGFERIICNTVGPKYGLPHLPIQKMRCTEVMALALGLPAGLDNACHAVALPLGKDKVGKRTMMKMTKPRKPKKGDPADGRLLWHETPEDHERLRIYCAADIEAERALEKRLLPLSKQELELWFLDQEINDRGVMVDVTLAEGAVKIVEVIADRLNDRMRVVSCFEVNGVTDVTGLKRFATQEGCPDVDSLAKDNVIKLLIRDDLTPALRECLEIRQEGAKASVAKVDALLRGRCADGRAKGILQFNAAHTTRWGGRRFQPQNLKRPMTGKKWIAGIIESVRQGRWSEFDELCYGPALAAIGDVIRGMVMAAPGKMLTAADFSNIEGRVLAWLAGETWKLGAFRKYDTVLGIDAKGKEVRAGPDLYVLAYARSFGVSLDSVTDFMRQIGKVMELALGYQGGVGAFLQMAKGYGLEISEFHDVIRDNAPEAFAKATESYSFRGRASGTAARTWIPAETLKLLWREAHPAIVKFWDDIEDAAILACDLPGSKVKCGPHLTFLKRGSFLFMRTPDGTMAYPFPEVREVPYFGKTKPALTYKTVPDPLKPGKIIPEADGSVNMRWARISTYGGMLAENATQKVARDILANGMKQLAADNWPIVLHVHDEIVAESNASGPEDLADFVELMTGLPEVYAGLPITAAGFQAARYRK